MREEMKSPPNNPNFNRINKRLEMGISTYKIENVSKFNFFLNEISHKKVNTYECIHSKR